MNFISATDVLDVATIDSSGHPWMVVAIVALVIGAVVSFICLVYFADEGHTRPALLSLCALLALGGAAAATAAFRVNAVDNQDARNAVEVRKVFGGLNLDKEQSVKVANTAKGEQAADDYLTQVVDGNKVLSLRFEKVGGKVVVFRKGAKIIS
jgi:hypothetical protein